MGNCFWWLSTHSAQIQVRVWHTSCGGGGAQRQRSLLRIKNHSTLPVGCWMQQYTGPQGKGHAQDPAINHHNNSMNTIISNKDFNYVAQDKEDEAVARGGVACPFPWRLHEMLKVTEEEGLEDVVSWAPHGRAFIVHKPKVFAETVMKRFFSQTKYPSFQRQLNMYGFSRFTSGEDKGAYWHLCFVRGHRSLVRNMIRRKIKGSKICPFPPKEPNFYDPAWKNHFEDSFPPSLQTSRTVSPSFVSGSWHNASPTLEMDIHRLVDRIPQNVVASPVEAPHEVSIGEGSLSDDSFELALYDMIEFGTTEASDDHSLVIPESFFMNAPVYEDPFEPTPLEEPVYHQTGTPFF